jgi:hypothetical protein
MGRTENPNLKNDYERAFGWYGHFNKSEMALFSECTDRYAQKTLDTADIVREAISRQLTKAVSGTTPLWPPMSGGKASKPALLLYCDQRH